MKVLCFCGFRGADEISFLIIFVKKEATKAGDCDGARYAWFFYFNRF